MQKSPGLHSRVRRSRSVSIGDVEEQPSIMASSSSNDHAPTSAGRVTLLSGNTGSDCRMDSSAASVLTACKGGSNTKPFEVVLTEHRVIHFNSDSVDLEDVVGAKAFEMGGGGGAAAVEVYAYPRTRFNFTNCCLGGGKGRYLKRLHWQVPAGFDAADKWAKGVMKELYPLTSSADDDIPIVPPNSLNYTQTNGGSGGGGGGEINNGGRIEMNGFSPPHFGHSLTRRRSNRNLLVFINPYSGAGKGEQYWRTIIRPMFEHAELKFTAVMTERQGHTYDVCAGVAGALGGVGGVIDVTEYSDIVIMSGDGLVYEALQGIFSRPDHATVLANLTFGVIPCGTGNGLAKTVTSESDEDMDVITCGLLIVKGISKPLDLVRTKIFRRDDGSTGTSSTSTSTSTDLLSSVVLNYGFMNDVDIESEPFRWLGAARYDLFSVVAIVKFKAYHCTVSYLPVTSSSSSSPKEEETGGGGNWVTITDDFLLVTVSTVQWLTPDLRLCPQARLGSGEMWLSLVRKSSHLSRLLFTRGLLAAQLGTHGEIDRLHGTFEQHRIKAIRLEPELQLQQQRGILTVDGEVMAPPVQMVDQTIWPAATNICIGGASGGGDSGGGSRTADIH